MIKIKKDVFKMHPKLNLGFILVKNMNNHSFFRESKHLLGEAELMTHLIFHKRNVKGHLLIAPWVIIQEQLGAQGKHYHTSIERLLNEVLKHKKVSAKDTLTNLMRYLSLKRIIPLELDDYNKIKGNLTFTIANGKEKKTILKKLDKGHLYYHDERNILGTKFDYWKNRKTVLTNKSKSALIHIEALPPITKKKLDEHLKEAKNLIISFCGGEIKTFVLSKRKNSIKI